MQLDSAIITHDSEMYPHQLLTFIQAKCNVNMVYFMDGHFNDIIR